MADPDPFGDAPQWHTNPLHKPSTSFHMNPMYHPVPDAPIRSPPPAKDDIFRFAPPEMRLRSGSYNDVLQAVEKPGPPLKRRSRSLTDITSVLPVTPGSSSWGGSPVCDLPPPSHPPPSGKVAIRRAPEEILGRPVHIVTKQEKKAAHSAMERRYRKELNVQINLLRQLVMPTDEDGSVNKVTILKNTTEYVRAVRQQQQALQRPVLQLPSEHRDLYNRWIAAEEAVADLEDRISRQARMIESLSSLAMAAVAVSSPAATAAAAPPYVAPLAAMPALAPRPSPTASQQPVPFTLGSPVSSPMSSIGSPMSVASPLSMPSPMPTVPSPRRATTSTSSTSKQQAPPPPPPSRVVPPSSGVPLGHPVAIAPMQLPPLPTAQPLPPRPAAAMPSLMLPGPPPPLGLESSLVLESSAAAIARQSSFLPSYHHHPGQAQLHQDEQIDVFNAVNFDAYDEQGTGALFDPTNSGVFDH